MSDDTVQSTEPDEVVQSLDDVIGEFNIGEQNIEPQPQQFAQEQAVQPQVQTLDPFDEAQMQQFQQNNANQFGQISGDMNSLSERLAHFEQMEAQKAIDADVKSAVDTVNKIVGHDNDKWIEFQLQDKARTNPGFQKLWDNRAQNPQAFQKALTAIGNELKANSTEMLSDPQLAENQRAVNQSQMNSNVNAPEVSSMEDKLASATTEAERDAIWQKAVHGY